MILKFLGSSDSAGIPVHNCTCCICAKYRKENRQNLSTCAYLEINNTLILLDAGIDALSNILDTKKISAIFLTHFHADHCLGLLKLRYSKDSIKCYHAKDRLGFSDLFKHKESIYYKEINSFDEIIIDDIKVTSLSLKHSRNTLGYVLEYKNRDTNITIAYLTDCYGLSTKSLAFLKTKNITHAFIDACYDERKDEGNHLNYKQASKILDELNVRNGYLMHISHSTQEYIKKNNIKLKYLYVKDDENFDLD